MGARCCTDRRKKQFGLQYEVDPTLQDRENQKDPEAVDCIARLRDLFGAESAIIGVVGEEELKNELSSAYLSAIGEQLSTDLQGRVCFLTCDFGTARGAQLVFNSACSSENASKVFTLQPRGDENDPANSQQTLLAGGDLDHTLQIYSQVCDFYITVEGADLVTEAVMQCSYWGAVVVPLICTGGASSGKHHFPEGLLQPPACVTEEQWSELSRDHTTPEKLANGVSDILDTLVDAREEALELHRAHGGNEKLMRHEVAAKPNPFDRGKVVTSEEARVMEDLDFEAVMSAWKPKATRDGGAVKILDASTLWASREDEPKDKALEAPPPPAARGNILSDRGIEAPPPPREVETHDEAILDEITQMRKRMDAKLEEVHAKSTQGATKVQAVFRGKMARKATGQLKEDRGAEPESV